MPTVELLLSSKYHLVLEEPFGLFHPPSFLLLFESLFMISLVLLYRRGSPRSSSPKSRERNSQSLPAKVCTAAAWPTRLSHAPPLCSATGNYHRPPTETMKGKLLRGPNGKNYQRPALERSFSGKENVI